MKTSMLSRYPRLVLLFFLLLTLPTSPVDADMNEYCASPPFVAQSISPNILIVLDNSGSMCGQAYSGDYDTSQFTNGLYYGYFDGNLNYQYTSNGRWEVTTEEMITGTVANPIANGSFLNWANMRRTEVSKKLLIGGKANPRSPESGQTVKLNGETGCDRSFNKDFDTGAGTFIYPFVGNYNFARDNREYLTINSNDASQQFIARPEGDIQAGSWQQYPTNGGLYDKVDDPGTGNGNTDYITNVAVSGAANLAPVMLGFNYTQATPAGMLTVKIYSRARKTVNQQRALRGVLRIDGIDYESSSTTLGTSYPTTTPLNWTWENNPATGAAWTWDQIQQLAGSGNLQGFGLQMGSSNYTANTIRATQIYLQIEITYPSGGPYNLIVDQGMVKAQGLIDNLDNEVRFGLSYYNNNNAGRVDTYIGFNSPTNMITSIHNMTPNTWTPLGETLREMVGYFRQDNPYYSNSPADYSVGTGNFGATNIYRDPYAYKFTDIDSTLTNMYVHCAKSFILFLTDGESTQDQSMPTALQGYSAGVMPSPHPATERFAGTTVGTTYPSNGTDYMVDVAYWARTNDMRPGTETDVPDFWRKSLPGIQNVILYPVFMFGTGSSLLKDAAIYGGFNDVNGNNQPDCLTIPSECFKDSNGDGIVTSDGRDLPLTYYEGDDGYALEQNIKNAIFDIVKRAASSTAVSVLSSSEGSGANLVQSLFYPKRSFSTAADISWTSDIMNYWYYMDPFFRHSQIREDTIREDSDFTLLDLQNDYITQFYFDAAQQKTLAVRCQDTDGDGDCDTVVDSIPIEDARAIWRAGINLWWTDPADRRILTSLDGSTLIPFDTSNVESLDDYLGQTNSAEAAMTTIDFVRGYDMEKLCTVSRTPCLTDFDCPDSGDLCLDSRSRTAPLQVCSVSRMPCNTTLDCTGDGGICAEETHTWKLGDVVSSTPRIMGPSPLNSFHIPPPIGYGDKTYSDFIRSDSYRDRQRVFVGSNDGMFHAFRLGKVLQNWPGKEWWQPGRIEGSTGPGGIGTESWAFIPKNALPYLQHLSQPDYCHVYMVDGPVFLTDASIACNLTGRDDYWNCPKIFDDENDDNSWRSVAIGSMGIGGATSSEDNASCITTPVDVNGTPVGWSSYFALDVTSQDDPELLWEFSNPSLGVTNVGPAIVRVGGEKRCNTTNDQCTVDTECNAGGQCLQTNGRWFAILASGATGPITARDFKGTSNQNLKLFVLDLKTGELLRTIDTFVPNAFAGSISSNSIDLQKSQRGSAGHYQDDVVYIGFVQNTTNGGVLRLVINNDINPENWATSTVIDNIGPVTTSVVNLLDRRSNKLWLYFAEGRYFYKQDDLSTQRRLFGVQEPCFVNYEVLPSCTTWLNMTDLKDQTTAPIALTDTQKGWYVLLDPATPTVGAERVISNPTPDTSGAVFYLSFAPTSDICGYGGTTYLWAMDYTSGGRVTYKMQGKALVQVSTGEIKELDLSDSATFADKENRRSPGFQGIPPTGQGLMIITNPRPIKKYMHVHEQ